jgi:hypothetical protein
MAASARARQINNGECQVLVKLAALHPLGEENAAKEKEKITGCAKGPAASGKPHTPRIGKSPSGKRAVTAKGIASVTHSDAMNAATPNVRQPALESPSGAIVHRTKNEAAIPDTQNDDPPPAKRIHP